MDWLMFFTCLTRTAQSVLQVDFSCRFSERQSLSRRLLAALLLSFAVTAVFYSRYSALTPGAELLALYGINRIFLKNPRPSSCLLASLSACTAGFSLGVCSALEAFLLPEITANNPSRAFSIFCLLAFLALTAVVLCRLCFRQAEKHFSFVFHPGTSNFGPLTAVVLILLAVEHILPGKAAAERYELETSYGAFLDLPYNTDRRQPLLVLALQLLGMGILFLVLFGYRHIQNERKTRQTLTQELQAQKTYTDQARTRYENTRAFRHDVRNHLSVLEGLLKKGDMDKAQSYLKKLNAVSSELSLPVYTGNPVLDILLGNKLELAKEAGITAEVSLGAPAVEADDLDWCIIFANALDNAIAACREAGGEPFLRISGERQGRFYLLEFENTCVPGPESPMGTGLSNLRASAEKYGGTVSVEKTDSLFRLSILWQQPHTENRKHTDIL